MKINTKNAAATGCCLWYQLAYPVACGGVFDFEHNKYRLIYRKEDERIDILAVHVGKRTDSFYGDFKRRLKNYVR